MLGLTRKGHLGPGADGDVTIYAPDDDKERMFSLPRYLIKAGEVVLDDGDDAGHPRWADPFASHPRSTRRFVAALAILVRPRFVDPVRELRR